MESNLFQTSSNLLQYVVFSKMIGYKHSSALQKQILVNFYSFSLNFRYDIIVVMNLSAIMAINQVV